LSNPEINPGIAAQEHLQSRHDMQSRNDDRQLNVQRTDRLSVALGEI
jgi:hypothetical protein